MVGFRVHGPCILPQQDREGRIQSADNFQIALIALKMVTSYRQNLHIEAALQLASGETLISAAVVPVAVAAIPVGDVSAPNVPVVSLPATDFLPHRTVLY